MPDSEAVHWRNLRDQHGVVHLTAGYWRTRCGRYFPRQERQYPPMGESSCPTDAPATCPACLKKAQR